MIAIYSLIYFAVYYSYFYYMVIVSNYEIAEWQWYFLELWHENTDTQFIDADILLTKLGVSEIPVLKKFFQPNGINFLIILKIEFKVSICTFLEFICIFTFFSYTELIPSIFYDNYY